MDLNEARQLGSELIVPLETEWVPLEEALGRVLGERITADRNLPGESRSRLDGFALRGADSLRASTETPTLLRILPGRIAAGQVMEAGIASGECIRILTGAPLPRDADAVAPQEEVGIQGENLVLGRVYVRGSGITFGGDDAQSGEFLVSQGAVLNPTRLALIAALGRDRVAVYRQPQVALLATGDEVKTLGTEARGPFTYCNNMHLLAWLTKLKGGKTTLLGVAADEPGVIADRLRDVAADLVITTGGSGRGDRDFIPEVWKRLGVRQIFRQINLIPGKNTALGVRHGQVFLGLPGNPWAAQIVFDLLAVPLLRRWQGLEGAEQPLIAATLQALITCKPGFYKALRGTLDLGRAPARFLPAVTKSASVFSRVKDCFAYILLEPHVIEVAAESEVQVHLSDFPLLASPLIKGAGAPTATD
jgi:molybdopterin molybdotransferase